MPAITDRMPPVAIEYDARGGRVAKRFDDPYEARQFYVRLTKAGRRPAVKNPNARKSDEMATKQKKTRRSKAPVVKATTKKPRVTVLGHSAMAVLRWMGANGWGIDAATTAIGALGEGGQLKQSSIATGLSDGRSGKWGAPAAVTTEQAKQLKRAAGQKQPNKATATKQPKKPASSKAAGTKRSRIRACLSKQPKTMRQLMEESGVGDTHYNFLNGLVKAGEVVRTEDGYRLP